MTFNYKDEEGIERFYIPDFYIDSMNLIIEVKSADNQHYRARDLDREKLKDASVPEGFNFVKVLDKHYKELDNFFIKNKK
jgi:very-short-patch-repair endonuclease